MNTKIYMLTAMAACIGLILTGFPVSVGQLETNATLPFSGIVQQTSTPSPTPETYSYIISISGSNYQMKDGTTGQIDYQSTDSSKVFGNAVASCPAGGTIDFMGGVYTVATSWTILGANDITLNFESGAILKAANNLNAPVLYLKGANNCVISGITIDGNAANQLPTAGTMVEIPEDGILIDPISSNNHVDRANITNCGLMGIRIGDGASTSNGITNSLITFCGWNGIGFGLYTSNSYAKNVQVAYCGDVGISTYGSGSVITDNYVHDMNGTSGHDNANWGIAVEGGGIDIITQNNVQNCLTGIQNSGFNNCTISDNTLFDNIACGIALNLCEYNSVKNNHVTKVKGGGEIGIWLGGASFNEISGNNVSYATYSGIVLDTSSNNNKLILNHVFNNGIMGMDILGSSNYISQNQVYDDRSGSSRTQYHGILMESDAQNNALIGNNAYNNAGNSIYDLSIPENTKINNIGYNPVGYIGSPISGSTGYLVDSGTISTWMSGRVYTNSGSPKVLDISSGTVSLVARNGVTLFTTTGCTVTLQPGDTFSVTFSKVPTINVNGQ